MAVRKLVLLEVFIIVLWRCPQRGAGHNHSLLPNMEVFPSEVYVFMDQAVSIYINCMVPEDVNITHSITVSRMKNSDVDKVALLKATSSCCYGNPEPCPGLRDIEYTYSGSVFLNYIMLVLRNNKDCTNAGKYFCHFSYTSLDEIGISNEESGILECREGKSQSQLSIPEVKFDRIFTNSKAQLSARPNGLLSIFLPAGIMTLTVRW